MRVRIVMKMGFAASVRAMVAESINLRAKLDVSQEVGRLRVSTDSDAWLQRQTRPD